MNKLEQKVKGLENLQLMYKPPMSEDYLTLTQTLNDLYKKIDILGRYAGR